MNNKEKTPFINISNNKKLYLGEIIKQINGELTLQNFEFGLSVANRTSIINHLIKKNNLKNYLEIGVRDLRNFEKIIIENRVGVDPYPLKMNGYIVKTDSNNFFLNNKEIFDIIFIDGYIIMHDCNPPSAFHQREVYEVNGKFPAWNGTAWKSYAKLRIFNRNLNMSCVDCDWGVGVIKKGFQKKFETKREINYSLLEQERSKLLNLISVNNFIKTY